MNNYNINFQYLTKYVKPSDIYKSIVILYFCVEIWIDAKKKLIQYRENKLDRCEKDYITNEWKAVKYGAYENFIEKIITSIFWPINTIIDFIPFMVLQCNPLPIPPITKIDEPSIN